jgi:hypothetical protein
MPATPKRRKSLDRPLDLSVEARHLDHSATPAALIELARVNDDLVLLDDVEAEQVLIEFPMGERWRRQTGYERFIRLRRPIDGRRYALIRPR